MKIVRFGFPELSIGAKLSPKEIRKKSWVFRSKNLIFKGFFEKTTSFITASDGDKLLMAGHHLIDPISGRGQQWRKRKSQNA